MESKTEVVMMRVPAEEKQRAKDLADQCGLSLTGLWRAMLAETDLHPVIGWKPVRRAGRPSLASGQEGVRNG